MSFQRFEYDRFQNLDLRFVLGGIDFNGSRFSTPLTRKPPEFHWGDQPRLSRVTACSTTSQNSGYYRVNFDAGTSTKLTRWLNWNLSLSDRYLNHPD